MGLRSGMLAQVGLKTESTWGTAVTVDRFTPLVSESVTEEIERMEGEQRFLADQVAMSTIAATFRSTVAAPPPTRPRRREPSRFDWLESIGAERVMEGF